MFQSLGRDSVRSDLVSPVLGRRSVGFQSLGRDSVRSDFRYSCASRHCATCFNPSVGILFVQTYRGHTDHELPDGFQSLGRDSVRSDIICLFVANESSWCFNPSVGILFVQTWYGILSPKPRDRFQSLGRDSVRSDLILEEMKLRAIRVSIPRSGFCSFRPKILNIYRRPI